MARRRTWNPGDAHALVQKNICERKQSKMSTCIKHVMQIERVQIGHVCATCELFLHVLVQPAVSHSRHEQGDLIVPSTAHLTM